MLRGTIREYGTGQRRAFLRFFACEEDWSLESPDKPLPEAVASGKEPLLILGAIAGGEEPEIRDQRSRCLLARISHTPGLGALLS